MSLDVRSVAAVLHVSPTTLYKYRFNEEINAAERRQRGKTHLSGSEIEKRFFAEQLDQLKTELEKERENRSRGVVSSRSEACQKFVPRRLEHEWRAEALSAFLMRAQCGYTSSVTVKPFTHKQGQYLAFIHYFSKVNRRPPAEADMQRYFQVSPPSVHQMILTLEANRFIQRTPGQGRSIRLLLAREDLPDLE